MLAAVPPWQKSATALVGPSAEEMSSLGSGAEGFSGTDRAVSWRGRGHPARPP